MHTAVGIGPIDTDLQLSTDAWMPGLADLQQRIKSTQKASLLDALRIGLNTYLGMCCPVDTRCALCMNLLTQADLDYSRRNRGVHLDSNHAGGRRHGAATPSRYPTVDIHHASVNTHSMADAVHFGLPAG